MGGVDEKKIWHPPRRKKHANKVVRARIRSYNTILNFILFG